MNTPEIKVRDLPNMECPQCHVLMVHGTDIQNPKREAKRGDIMVCSSCSCISKVTDAGLFKMTPGEVTALDNQSKVNLAAAVASVQAKIQKGN